MLRCFLSSKRASGFTLVELLVVMAIVAVLSGIGITTAMQYMRSVSVDNAAKDFANTLQIAKSRAFSNVGVSGCTGSLLSYRVDILANPSQYQLIADCSGVDKVYAAKKLPSGVAMTRPHASITFPALKGNVILGSSPATTDAAYSFTSSSGLTRIVTVYDDGRIVVQ